jgi:serine protease AprX
MERVIVELRRSAPAAEAMAMGEASAAARVDLPGFQLDAEFGAIPVPATSVASETEVAEMGVASALAEVAEDTVIVRGEVDEAQKQALMDHPDVVMVWTDAEVAPFGGCGCTGDAEVMDPVEAGLVQLPDFDTLVGNQPAGEGDADAPNVQNVTLSNPCPPTDCQPTVAKGTIADVAAYLGCTRLWSQGIRGQGVAIGIVDTGVDKTRVANVVDGWSPTGTSPWGTDGGHGSMCATDAGGMAPAAEIHDIGVLKSSGIPATLSNAIAGFQWAINRYKSTGKPQILSNSWGMYRRAWAPDYATDPNHPFTRKVVEAINEGMIVTFAAGNCGQVCPDGRCGTDTGPAKSIWGANGHPRVITVGAANIREEWIGYSSQGPAALDPRKPDFVAPSHFRGWYASDNGTSAANPVVAGVIALLRGHDPGLRQDAVKKALQETAKDLCGQGWDQHSGHGMIHADRAFHKLNFFTTPLVHASWIHGHAARVERPEDLELQRLFGFYSQFVGKPNSFNWFHFAIPTPVIVSGRRLRLDSIMTQSHSGPQAVITSIHIWDSNTNLRRYDGLSLSGSHWFQRFDVLNDHVRFGIGVSIGVRFGTGSANDRQLILGSCGGDFIA